MNKNAEIKIQKEIAREENRLEKLENKIAEEERKIQQYKKRINQLEKRKKKRDQIFIGKTLLEKWMNDKIKVDEMREIINILYKEDGEKRKEFIAIINRYESK